MSPPRRQRPSVLRVLIHAQHLSGVGHWVRAYEIARCLARRHEVYLCDGGRGVPRRPGAYAPTPIELPRLARGGTGLAALDAQRGLTEVLLARERALVDAVRRIRPQVLLLEHYPFSKWELEGEMLAAIDAARRAAPRVLIVSSVRDLAPRTRHEPGGAQEYEARVLAALHARFDGLLVHADPALTRLADHFPAASRIEIPVEHTGIVSEKPCPTPAGTQAIERATGGRPFVLASSGGRAATGLARLCLEAWGRVRGLAAFADHRLVVFSGLDQAPGELPGTRRERSARRVVLLPFSPDFLAWLAASDLSIAHAGYNTCANLLETGTRAVLVPDPEMADQELRARALAALGSFRVVAPARGPGALAEAMELGLSDPLPRSTLCLDGAERTRSVLEGWFGAA